MLNSLRAIRNAFNHLRKSDRLRMFLLLGVVIPILLLAGFGLFVVVRDGYWLYAAAVSAMVCVLAGLPMLLWRKPQAASATAAPEPTFLEQHDMPKYWRPLDRDVYARMMPALQIVLKQNPEWKALPEHGWVLAQQVAQCYHQDHAQAHWAVTPVELLTVTETLSQRYRRHLQDYVPGADQISISRWMWLDTQVDRLWPWAKSLYRVFRVGRLLTPAGALAELRDQVLDRLSDGVSNDVQGKIKTFLLRDIICVAIDLYGGHYRHIDPTAAQDTQHHPLKLEPVRICLIGQTGAGKSSIINALIGSVHAEVNILPATDRKTVYDCTIAGEHLLQLIDLPGLTPQTAPELLTEMTQCDMVVWALQANQSARALDVDLREQLRQRYANTPTHKPPILLGVLTHADRLVHPGARDDPQALVDDALAYTRDLMALDTMLALSLAQGSSAGTFSATFPISRLQDALQQHHENAIHVQLARRRLQDATFSAKRELHRALQAGKALWRHL